MKNTKDANFENTESSKKEEPLFRVVIPKRRSWVYTIMYSIRGSKFFEALLGPQVKALPAPAEFRN